MTLDTSSQTSQAYVEQYVADNNLFMYSGSGNMKRVTRLKIAFNKDVAQISRAQPGDYVIIEFDRANDQHITYASYYNYESWGVDSYNTKDASITQWICDFEILFELRVRSFRSFCSVRVDSIKIDSVILFPIHSPLSLIPSVRIGLTGFSAIRLVFLLGSGSHALLCCPLLSMRNCIYNLTAI